jgi:hypothetical protein
VVKFWFVIVGFEGAVIVWSEDFRQHGAIRSLDCFRPSGVEIEELTHICKLEAVQPASEAAASDIVLNWASSDHDGLNNAVFAGLKRKGSQCYLIHTSGTGLLTYEDSKKTASRQRVQRSTTIGRVWVRLWVCQTTHCI